MAKELKELKKLKQLKSSKKFVLSNFMTAYDARCKKFNEWKSSFVENANYSDVEFGELFTHALETGCEGLLLYIGRFNESPSNVNKKITTLLQKSFTKRVKFVIDVYQVVPSYWMLSVAPSYKWDRKFNGETISMTKKKYDKSVTTKWRNVFFISCFELQQRFVKFCLQYLSVPGICEIISLYLFGQRFISFPGIHSGINSAEQANSTMFVQWYKQLDNERYVRVDVMPDSSEKIKINVTNNLLKHDEFDSSDCDSESSSSSCSESDSGSDSDSDNTEKWLRRRNTQNVTQHEHDEHEESRQNREPNDDDDNNDDDGNDDGNENDFIEWNLHYSKKFASGSGKVPRP